MSARLQTISLVIGRVVIGGYFINFGLSTWTTPNWSLNPLITNARTFPTFYQAVASSAFIPALVISIKIVCLLIGVALVLGIFVRLSSLLGIIFMLFLYFPTLAFPYVCNSAPQGLACSGSSLYIVNTYLIVAVALSLLWAFGAGDVLSLGSLFRSRRRRYF